MHRAYICSWDEARRYVGSYVIYKDHERIFSRERMEMPHCTCNEAEYLTLHKLLMKLDELEIYDCNVYTHVELVARQINGQWKVRTPSLINYVNEGKRLRIKTGAKIEWLNYNDLKHYIKGSKAITWRVGM
jgi:ribonuclease HI